MNTNQEILTILNQIPSAVEKALTEVLVLRHPGHGSQKVHGHRHGEGGSIENARQIFSNRAAKLGYKNIQFKPGKNGILEIHASAQRGGKLKKTKIHIDEQGRIISGKLMMTDTGWTPVK